MSILKKRDEETGMKIRINNRRLMAGPRLYIYTFQPLTRTPRELGISKLTSPNEDESTTRLIRASIKWRLKREQSQDGFWLLIGSKQIMENRQSMVKAGVNSRKEKKNGKEKE